MRIKLKKDIIKKVMMIIFTFAALAAVIVGVFILRYNAKKGEFLAFWNEKMNDEGELLYIALGDSTVTGIGASSPQDSYVWRVKEMFEKENGKSVRVVNLGYPGARTADLINNQLPKLSKYKNPDLVTVSVGANDSNHNVDPDVTIKNLEKIISSLPKGSFVAEVPGIRFKDKNKTLKINTKLKLAASKNNVRVVPIYEVLQKHINDLFIYDLDLFHPNNKGYTIWTNVFWDTINR